MPRYLSQAYNLIISHRFSPAEVLGDEVEERGKDDLEKETGEAHFGRGPEEKVSSFKSEPEPFSSWTVACFREDRAASVVSNSGDGVNTAKGAKVVKAGTPVRQGKPGAEEPKPSKIVACSNFPTAFNCNPEVERYLRECHENVREVRRQGNKVLVTFKDQRSSERFVGLAYVKYRVGPFQFDRYFLTHLDPRRVATLGGHTTRKR